MNLHWLRRLTLWGTDSSVLSKAGHWDGSTWTAYKNICKSNTKNIQVALPQTWQAVRDFTLSMDAVTVTRSSSVADFYFNIWEGTTWTTFASVRVSCPSTPSQMDRKLVCQQAAFTMVNVSSEVQTFKVHPSIMDWDEDNCSLAGATVHWVSYGDKNNDPAG